MSIAEKLLTIAENEQRVYDAGYEKGKAEGGGGDTEAAFAEGKSAGEKAVWDGITANNTRTSWASAFQYWGCEYLRPPFVIAPTKSSINSMFEANKKLKKVESKYFDFSNYVCGQTTSSTNAWYRTFFECSTLEEVEDLGMQAGGYFYTYSNCKALKDIAVMRVQADTQYNNHLNNCIALENLTVEGTIGQNGFNTRWSTKLTKASLISILEACNADVTASPKTITLPKKCIDGATDTEALLESLGGDYENTIYTLGASTLQLPHTNIKPNTVSLIPVDENGNQTNPDWIDDGNGNIIYPWYPEDQQFVGTIDYATGLIDISSGYGYFGELNKYTKCQYTVDSAYNMALSKGYNIAFA